MEREFFNELVKALQGFKGELARTFITDEKLDYTLKNFKMELNRERLERIDKTAWSAFKIVSCLIIGGLIGANITGTRWYNKHSDIISEMKNARVELQNKYETQINDYKAQINKCESDKIQAYFEKRA